MAEMRGAFCALASIPSFAPSWQVLFLAIGWFFAVRRRNRHEQCRVYEELGGDDEDKREVRGGGWILDLGLVSVHDDPTEWRVKHCSCCCGEEPGSTAGHDGYLDQPLL